MSISEENINKDQIIQIERDLSREKAQYEKFGHKEKTLLGRLSNLEKKIVEQRKILEDLGKRVNQSKIELSIRRSRLKGLQQSLNPIRQRASKRLVLLYRNLRKGFMNVLAASKDLDDLRRRVKYLQVIMEKDQGLLRQMSTLQEKYRQELLLAEQKLDLVTRMEDAEKRQLTSIREDLDRKVILLMKIHRERVFYETAVKELQLAARELKETLVHLDSDQGKRRLLPTAFAESKGNLPLPFDGKITRKGNPLDAENLNTHRGIYIEGPSGAKVKAVYSGRVDFSGWLKGYGQIIVLNHGTRFFTVSAHLAERYKQEGDVVEEGTVIGLLGETGSLRGPGLYFEIRKGGDSLDPLKWLKVH
jgi:septal ring factor EnvC (AmiA/AmiB activator)